MGIEYISMLHCVSQCPHITISLLHVEIIDSKNIGEIYGKYGEMYGKYGEI